MEIEAGQRNRETARHWSVGAQGMRDCWRIEREKGIARANAAANYQLVHRAGSQVNITQA
jgi:hypothetical protein